MTHDGALRAALGRLDVRGRVAFVQSSWRALRQAVATPREAIELLCEAVGTDGTVVMPTYPMAGLSQVHLDEHPFFDCRHTPSKSGALTEVFRQTPGVRRSVHPTHPVAAYGRLAGELTAGHEQSSVPFDANSPFHKMYEAEAVSLNFGVHLTTFRHLADDLMQDVLPHDVYADRVTSVRIIDCEGTESRMETRGHNPHIDSNWRAVVDLMSRGGSRRWLRPTRRVLFRGAVTEWDNLDGLLVEWIPIRPYIATYRRCYRAGLLRYFPRGKRGVAA